MDERLPRDVMPQEYIINFYINYEKKMFYGNMTMKLKWENETKRIAFHSHRNLQIRDRSFDLRKCYPYDSKNIMEDSSVARISKLYKKSIYTLHLNSIIKRGTHCELYMEFEGHIWTKAEGLFYGSYHADNKSEQIEYIATNLHPNNARRFFPCFDEPEFKVPVILSISRPKNYVTLFNSQLKSTESQFFDGKDYLIDTFEKTLPMSTCSLGFMITQENKFNNCKQELNDTVPIIYLRTYRDVPDIKQICANICKIYKTIAAYLSILLPLEKFYIVTLPEVSTVRPLSNWGILILSENDLMQIGNFTLIQELVYQWIGTWKTPSWWNEIQINKAIVNFVAVDIALQIYPGYDFEGGYPMTMLYSLYYELSKRYPYSRITVMKQESASFKAELVLRMLNYTLSKSTLKFGIRKMISCQPNNIFSANIIWEAINNRTTEEGNLNPLYNISEIADSWISTDRLPVVSLQRNYTSNTAKIYQKMFLRERPHDVQDQENKIWWIPIVLVEQNRLDFLNTTPYLWMENTMEGKLTNLSNRNSFVIMNPEEIAPFMVNYDQHNWKMISNYLKNKKNLENIPALTRAKLINDAWNLAYAGELSFSIALDVTLFLKCERNHIVWNPVFTLIDQIGRRIEISRVYHKFQQYVVCLLSPLYEDLSSEGGNGSHWKTNLRKLAREFLCKGGYEPCIEEARNTFEKWMNQNTLDFGIRIENLHICPILRWGTMKEWELILNYVLHFPENGIKSERTFLLKSVAGCPLQENKIHQLLNLTLLQNNPLFSNGDLYIIIRTLAKESVGYQTLFEVLSYNFMEINVRFQNETNIWDNLISSATGMFTTQQGYDKVTQLYRTFRGHFNSAEHIIQTSVRNIKEEVKWSNEAIPAIEKWLDNYFNKTLQ
nr:aminopeptidase N isoform X2 [Bactrocera oleae]XP_036229921.1 aminopeptidase N isoform X2 [Bactrocera oleae]